MAQSDVYEKVIYYAGEHNEYNVYMHVCSSVTMTTWQEILGHKHIYIALSSVRILGVPIPGEKLPPLV